MLSFLAGLLRGILGFLSGVLPNSPFQDVISGIDNLQLGLGWLNWVMPVGDCLLIFGLWLTAALVWAAVDFALNKATGVVDGLAGGKS